MPNLSEFLAEMAPKILNETIKENTDGTVKIVSTVGDQLDKRAQRNEMRLDGEVRRHEELLNGETERYNSIKKQKADRVSQYAGTVFNGIEAVANVCNKILESRNVSKDIKSQIEERKGRLEKERIKLDNEMQAEMERIRLDKKKADDSHEETMDEMRQRHERDMKIIESISEKNKRNINYCEEIINILKQLISDDPHNPLIQILLTESTKVMLSLSENTKYLQNNFEG